MTVKELYKYCKEQIDKGNEDKIIVISDDEEGNGYHDLYYAFSEVNEELDEDMYENLIRTNAGIKDIIILG